MAATLHQALEEVENRFLYVGGDTEDMPADRLFMAVEQAWWFYEDFFADKYPNSCPHFKTLNKFSKQLFEHCPLLKPYKDNMDDLFGDYLNYKGQIPSYGCILLNPSMTKVLLAKSYQGNNWTFPKGKVNEDERDNPLKCACRETFEEIGYDPTPNCRGGEDELTILEGQKFVRLYIGTDVNENFNFVPQTRKEISEVKFFDIGDCENKKIKTYHVFPFIKGIRRFIAKKKKNGGRSASNNNLQADANAAKSGKKAKKNTSNPKILSILENPNGSNGNSVKRSESGNKLRDINARNKDTFSEEGQGKAGAKGWTVDQMIKKNEEMIGRKIEYDGNSNNFGSSHPRFVNYLEQDRQKNGNGNVNEKVSSDDHSNGFTESKKQDSNGSSNGQKATVVDVDDMTLFKPVFQFDMAAIRAAMKSKLVLPSTKSSKGRSRSNKK